MNVRTLAAMTTAIAPTATKLRIDENNNNNGSSKSNNHKHSDICWCANSIVSCFRCDFQSVFSRSVYRFFDTLFYKTKQLIRRKYFVVYEMRASNDSSNYLFCFFFDSIKRLENSQRTIFLRFKTFPPFSSILLCSAAVCVRFSQVCFVLSPDPNNSIFRLEKIAAITKSANKNERMRENESLCVRSFLEVFQIQRIRLFFIVCFLLEFGSVCRFVLFVCERGDCFIFNARMSNVIENNTENVAS